MHASPDRPHQQPSTPTLVGRGREQAALRQALDAALAGRGSLVLIGGEAGIGKTALAEWTLAAAAGQGALALVGRCYDLAETPPYGPWRELFARAPDGDGLPALPAAVLPVNREGAHLAGQEAILARVCDFLAALAATQAVTLLLDDLHWADPASLDLLRVLGRQLTDLPLLVLATYRSDELTRRHPLYTLLPLLEREGRASRLDLRRLDTDALGALAAGRYALPGGDTARLVAWLAGRAEGNAFFTAQLLRALEDAGTLAATAARWTLGDLGSVGLPIALQQVLDARLDRLGEAARQHLALAAVIGQDVPLALWATVAETGEDALLDTIERAVEAHLLAESPDGSAVRFAHALVREALYEGTLATRRRRVHRRVAEALLAGPAPASGHPDPDAVAYHFVRAGDERAAGWLMRAGERAQRAYAWLTAAERYEAALPLLEAQGGDPGQRIALLITLAQLRRYGDTRRSVELMEEAARLADAHGDAAQAASAHFEAGHLRCIAGADRAGLAAMGEALPVLEALAPDERARLPALRILGVAPEERYHRGALAQWLTDVGRYAEGWDLAAPFRERLPGTTGRGLVALAQVHLAMGRPDEARRALAEARAIFQATGQHQQVAGALIHELDGLVLHYEAERVTERRRLATEAAVALARASGVVADLPPREAAIQLLALEGAWDEARALATVSRASTFVGARHGGAAAFARLAHRQGDLAPAWAAVREVLVAGPRTEPGGTRFIPAVALLAEAAALALDAGDLAAAREWLAARDRWLAWSGAVLWQADGRLGWATYHRAAGDLALARQYAEHAVADASVPRQPLALLAAHRLLGELDTAVRDDTAAGEHLEAALALADACAAPYEHALTLLALAELRAATGDRDGARAALDEARSLLMPLEARPALARADALAEKLAPAAPSGIL